MSNYYMFLKNNLIDFEKLLIDKYSFLGLDEIEVIIYNKEGSLSNFQDNIAYDESFLCITINGIIK